MSQTIKEMQSRRCPFTLSPTSGGFLPCVATECMACHELHCRATYEDHSGNALRAQELAHKRGRLASKYIEKSREGGYTIINLPALYVCLRLYPGADKKE